MSPDAASPASARGRLAERLKLDWLGTLGSGEERELAGLMSGVLYLTGAISITLLLSLPGHSLHHRGLVLVIAGLGALWGAACLTVIRWNSAPPYVSHASSVVGFVVAGVSMAATGGATSPARFYLFFIVVFAAYFYRPRTALIYLAGCALVHALPLLYQDSAVHAGFLRELLVVVPTYFVLGGGIIAGKHLLVGLREQAELAEVEQRRLAAEQGALRRLATVAAAGARAGGFYELVAEETGRLLGAAACGLLRFRSSEEAEVVGAWSDGSGGRYEGGTLVPVRPGSDIERMLATGRPERIDEHEPESPVAALGYACSVVSPVRVDEELWGFMAIVSVAPRGLPAGIEHRVSAFSELLATAIANAEDRTKLAAQATTDPLTGLVNHRSFHERLRAEVARAQRHRAPLALAIIDIDHFKEVNDGGGHEMGDRILRALAEMLRRDARAEDTVARIGGDEFALLLPETDRLAALRALERLRAQVRAESLEGYTITISAGICDLQESGDPESLFRLADGALYWSKAHGRDSAWVYDADVVQELSAQERAEHLQRSQALMGLRALARAIDARDATTRRHSERVAALAGALAEHVGWTLDRVALLREAALIHDVGKIGIADAVLLKAGPLTDAEYEQVKLHAALSAQIASEVLGAEQVAWISAHHERPDGGGYPEGLHEAQIPEGAALLAVADAWDVMTVSRPYSVPKTVAEALAECRRLAGRQFTVSAVAALTALFAEGALERLTAAAAAAED